MQHATDFYEVNEDIGLDRYAGLEDLYIESVLNYCITFLSYEGVVVAVVYIIDNELHGLAVWTYSRCPVGNTNTY